jgi:hypothetical protein
MGDLNNDGKEDVVVANWCAGGNSCISGSVSVLLGNGDGTFQLETPILSGGTDSSSVVIGDFNRDGKLDAVVANLCGVNGKGCRTGGTGGSVSVLLGNGDGTLQTAVSYALLGHYPRSLAVGDFNRDGKLDLAVADSSTTGDSAEILLGNGDGTFQPPVKYDIGASNCATVAVADFNGDGNLDLAAACQKVVSILLGKGDGTFQPASKHLLDEALLFIAIGDFNGDGKIDLAAAETDTNSPHFGAFDAIVLLGHGDGTFDPTAEYPTGGFIPLSVAVGDFDQDGKLDLAVTNSCGLPQQPCKSNGRVAVLLGKGDGSFQFPVNYDSEGRDPLHGPKAPVAVGDLNGDSRADLVVANQCAVSTCANGSIAVLLGNGDGTFQGQLVTNHYETSTTLTSTPNPSTVGQPVIFTATVASAGPDLPTGKVKFLDGGITSIGSATLSGGVAKLTKSTLVVGTHPITAQYLGDAASYTSTSSVVNQVVQ